MERSPPEGDRAGTRVLSSSDTCWAAWAGLPETEALAAGFWLPPASWGRGRWSSHDSAACPNPALAQGPWPRQSALGWGGVGALSSLGEGGLALQGVSAYLWEAGVGVHLSLPPGHGAGLTGPGHVVKLRLSHVSKMGSPTAFLFPGMREVRVCRCNWGREVRPGRK